MGLTMDEADLRSACLYHSYSMLHIIWLFHVTCDVTMYK